MYYWLSNYFPDRENVGAIGHGIKFKERRDLYDWVYLFVLKCCRCSFASVVCILKFFHATLFLKGQIAADACEAEERRKR